MYKGLVKTTDITNYNIFRGVTDFGNVNQFMAFEGGRSFIKVISSPRFLTEYALTSKDTEVAAVVNNYVHLLEYEFLGLEGLEDITSETQDINDGLRTLQLINKTTEQASATIALNGYHERSGGLMWRYHDMFLRGIVDPGSGFKHYHGLIQKGILKKGYANEIFQIMYFVTDSTGLDLEAAYLLSCCQLTNANQFANTQKGEYNFKEISVEMNCFPVRNDYVNKAAADHLKNMTIIRNSANYVWTGTEGMAGTNASSNGAVGYNGPIETYDNI
jgi:hypothetical protein